MLSIRAGIQMLSPRTLIRAVTFGLIASLATLAIIGITADVLANPWFEREEPVRTLDWIILIAISALSGALVSTYFLGPRSWVGTRTALASYLLGWLTLGLAAVAGFEGMIQALLGALSVALALGAFAVRMRMLLSPTCSLPAPLTAASPDT